MPCSSYYHAALRTLHSFPTRRSSDLHRCRWRVCCCGHWHTCAAPRTSSSSCTAQEALRSCTLHCSHAKTFGWSCRRNRWRCSARSEEHTSELQSRGHLVCRLLLEKKN